MSDLIQAAAPIIPVIDERLAYRADAPSSHKARIDEYNELLEDIYQREVELSRVKSALISMREDIRSEERHLELTSGIAGLGLAHDAIASSSKSDASESDETGVLSDSSGSDRGRRDANIALKSLKPGAKKPFSKAKMGKGSSKHFKVPDAQLDAEWDYKLELGRSSGKRGRRASDASEDGIRI
ncbi:unnamed protein product [Cyclocybe aegerita]|uniref:Uncharacterized protein n=1 Tax=Cyclocybe aegerita TaxID=1973307 RepID=A0A8S0VR35_CYCAE|nr:unnamed protein product [Cyclocybe aegerita]